MQLILLRHGNTFEPGQPSTQVGAKTDLPLTERGRQQANDFTKYLITHSIQPQAIYAGTLKRQTETATIINEKFHTSLHLEEPALTEIDYGKWEGLTIDEITGKWPNEYEAWMTQMTWPQGIVAGSFSWHVQTITLWLTTLLDRHGPKETVLGVTSNGIIRLFYSFLEKEWKRLQDTHQMEQLKVKTGHFCLFSLEAGSLEVTGWNLNPSIAS